MKEELGRGNEWGRPELTKKMLNATPGQSIQEVNPEEQPSQDWEFDLKAEFLKILRSKG